MSGEGNISPTSCLVQNLQRGDLKVAQGQHTTIDADDTVVTGLAQVLAVIAVLEADPVLTCDRITALIGDQAGAPAAGSIQIKSWMPTDSTLTTPVAATAFSKKVNWTAWGF